MPVDVTSFYCYLNSSPNGINAGTTSRRRWICLEIG
jgi:hypothetical protein